MSTSIYVANDLFAVGTKCDLLVNQSTTTNIVLCCVMYLLCYVMISLTCIVVFTKILKASTPRSLTDIILRDNKSQVAFSWDRNFYPHVTCAKGLYQKITHHSIIDIVRCVHSQSTSSST